MATKLASMQLCSEKAVKGSAEVAAEKVLEAKR